MTTINNTTSAGNLQYGMLPSQESLAAEFGGDAAAELAAMVFLFSRERSKDAAQDRDALENTIQAHEAKQVEALHDAADSRFWSGVVAGGTQILSGIATAAGSPKVGQALSGTGTIASSYLSKEADLESAEATAQASQAQSGIRALEAVNDNAAEAREMKDRTLKFMDTIQATKAEANKALVSIRV